MKPLELLMEIANSRRTTYTNRDEGNEVTIIISAYLWDELQEWARPRRDYPICNSCQTPILPGTTHTPFNGNQMFACTVIGENY